MVWLQMLARPYLLHTARTLQDVSATVARFPQLPLPAYLQQRAVSGQPLPSLTLVRQSAGRKRGGDEDERAEVLAFVLQDLPSDLIAELVHGLGGPTTD
jgi:hypothetical protein